MWSLQDLCIYSTIYRVKTFLQQTNLLKDVHGVQGHIALQTIRRRSLRQELLLSLVAVSEKKPTGAIQKRSHNGQSGRDRIALDVPGPLLRGIELRGHQVGDVANRVRQRHAKSPLVIRCEVGGDPGDYECRYGKNSFINRKLRSISKRLMLETYQGPV